MTSKKKTSYLICILIRYDKITFICISASFRNTNERAEVKNISRKLS